MTHFLKTLLALSVSGALMALLLLSLRYIFLRKMPATVYYYLWIIVLLRFMLPVPALIGPRTERIPAHELLQSTALEMEAAEEQEREYIRPGTNAYHDGEKAVIQAVPTPHPEKAQESFGLRALPWTGIVFTL